MNKFKLFLTRIIWGRKLTVVETQVLSSINRKMDNIIVIAKEGKFVIQGCPMIGNLTFIGNAELTTSDINQFNLVKDK